MKVEHELGCTLLKVSNVSLTLGGRQILRDVNPNPSAASERT